LNQCVTAIPHAPGPRKNGVVTEDVTRSAIPKLPPAIIAKLAGIVGEAANAEFESQEE
jgi:hypothetical protein